LIPFWGNTGNRAHSALRSSYSCCPPRKVLSISFPDKGIIDATFQQRYYSSRLLTKVLSICSTNDGTIQHASLPPTQGIVPAIPIKTLILSARSRYHQCHPPKKRLLSLPPTNKALIIGVLRRNSHYYRLPKVLSPPPYKTLITADPTKYSSLLSSKETFVIAARPKYRPARPPRTKLSSSPPTMKHSSMPFSDGKILIAACPSGVSSIHAAR